MPRKAGAKPAAKPKARRAPEPAQCPPHPRRRVIKNFCGACGRQVLNEKVT